ncbi:hypothetical protein ABB37_09492 [Leptomonas pyrrhocoris]|uniref:Nodulin-like domain-containing protein n=1 Tax=Leptomonas pyrrhocoris TaxID=157538 RepID=A0A0M9FQ86_LEPPY|nr:hypothetical protein ABB37_09492 [Leptomonas pyrrhocoris]XP_015652300.1 hypothetical protein ABB37_09492 [Leptomonas pyrrhocoris]KPA73860.1 hypothetical protein ABB37_09492 [Leptomonas pyrrhocoris]KPA73861.1 hypothetical protein ABB37_09492 [Leptomonas pyrrhocoris]|eukprot:XP_015652299.1 hypothetical protein ABB37_09492 [Leptomonas pyrrhocoris]
MKRELKVSFAASSEKGGKRQSANRTASQQYTISTAPRQETDVAIQQLVTPRSPLYPESVIPQQHRAAGSPSRASPPFHEAAAEPNGGGVGAAAYQSGVDDPNATAALDPASGAILIYPKKVDNLRRFRILFVGLLLLISSSTQGIHSLFGTLYLQVAYRFTVRQMAVVYLSGQAFGMFVFPFGMLYDWFGPRFAVAAASIIAALGHLLYALMFGGHIDVTVPHCAIFYGLMCWGCYALNVVVLPSVLTHMPRDRGQPTGLLMTFSGLGSSFFSCLFRGFFENNFENVMWFMFAVVVAVGVVGTWYLEDAPYMVNRWQQRNITPRQQLRKYLIRNRYMSQLVPGRRYLIMTVILILLNFYVTIQAVVVSYLADQMTDGKRRGIAIGAIVILLLCLILVVPFEEVDGPTEQDKQVIEAAKAKECEIREMHAQRTCHAGRHSRQAHEPTSRTRDGENVKPSDNPFTSKSDYHSDEVRVGAMDDDERAAEQSGSNAAPLRTCSVSAPSMSLKEGAETCRTTTVPAPPLPHHESSALSAQQHHHRRRSTGGGALTEHLGLPLYKLTVPNRSLISVDLDEDEAGEEKGAQQLDKNRISPLSSARRHSPNVPRRSLSLSVSRRCPHAAAVSASATPQLEELADGKQTHDTSYLLNFDDRGNLMLSSATVPHCHEIGGDAAHRAAEHTEEERTADFSFEQPRVEVITLCGEVFVAPVYQTTFWESLTYLDTWLIFYVTMCVWGVGLTMVGNWNIYIMLLARYGGMQQKHYMLFAAMAGVCTAGGRVFLGVYESMLQVIRERTGAAVVPTLLYPITSIGLLVGVIFWIALPGDKVLVLAYLIGPAFYGVSSSVTPYILGTIFDRDLGMHYGFCFLAGAVGFVLCYWCSWYLTYKNETMLTPLGELCIGQRRCMNRAVGIYVALVFSSIFPAYILHRRYSKLVRGKLVHRRVIVPRIKKMLALCGSGCCGEQGVKAPHGGDSDGDNNEVANKV